MYPTALLLISIHVINMHLIVWKMLVRLQCAPQISQWVIQHVWQELPIILSALKMVNFRVFFIFNSKFGIENNFFFNWKDPTDCTKYHVCNGTSHSIIECPASHQFTYDRSIQDPFTNPGNGIFSCQFRKEYESCMCERFYCSGMPNTFSFRSMDFFYYAYCLEIGTLKKFVMFKCPEGTRHNGYVTMENTVDCVPIEAPIV